MSRSVTHIVHKLNLEIEAPGERQARQLYNEAGTLLQQYVLPQLEALLQQYDMADQHIRIDTLDIVVDVAGTTSLEEVIKEQLAAAIATQVAAVLNGTDGDTVTGHGSKPIHQSQSAQVAEAFLYFLGSGSLPWWFADTAVLSDEAAIISVLVEQEAEFVPLFLEQVARNPIVLKRLLSQYDAVLLTYLYSLIVPVALLGIARNYEQEIMAANKNIPATGIRQRYWALVWLLYTPTALQTMPPELFRERLKQALPLLMETPGSIGTISNIVSPVEQDQDHPGTFQEQPPSNSNEQAREMTPATHTAADDPKQPEAVSTHGGIMSNAGLILLHPFLQYFFLELGFLDGEQFANDKAKGKAVHLLHYLATGSEQAADFELSFEKYLCGMEPQEITYRYTVLSDTMKTEAASLLAAVIKHWQVLKNTSVDGLREGFLQRKGKLLLKEESHHLVMERNSLDILLERVPWNISLVKLPWKNQLLHVAWQG